MHSDSQIFGRGAWHKSPDWAWGSGCHEAHRLLTAKINPEMNHEQKFTEWLKAYVATQDWLWNQGKIKLA